MSLIRVRCDHCKKKIHIAESRFDKKAKVYCLRKDCIKSRRK